MPPKHTKSFENYLGAIYEHCDQGSVITQETDILIETDRKIINKLKRSNYR